jgi:hypothetical protein
MSFQTSEAHEPIQDVRAIEDVERCRCVHRLSVLGSETRSFRRAKKIFPDCSISKEYSKHSFEVRL